MRPSMDPRQLLGYVALTLTLLLSGPGVTVVRAGDPLVSELPEAPSCSAQAPTHDAAQMEAIARYLEQRQAEAEVTPTGDVVVGTTPAGEEIVVLNNRGYNYGPTANAANLQAIQRELDRVLREAR